MATFASSLEGCGVTEDDDQHVEEDCEENEEDEKEVGEMNCEDDDAALDDGANGDPMREARGALFPTLDVSLDGNDNSSDVSSVISGVSGSGPSRSPSTVGSSAPASHLSSAPSSLFYLHNAAGAMPADSLQARHLEELLQDGNSAKSEETGGAGGPAAQGASTGGFAVPEPIQAPSPAPRPRGRGKRANRGFRGRILIPARAQWARMRAERAAAMAAARAASQVSADGSAPVGDHAPPAPGARLGAPGAGGALGDSGGGRGPSGDSGPGPLGHAPQDGEKRTLAGGDLKRFGGLTLIPGRTRKWRKVMRRVGNVRVPVWVETPNSEDPLLLAVQAMLRHGVSAANRRNVRHTRVVACHIKETTRQYLQQTSLSESAQSRLKPETSLATSAPSSSPSAPPSSPSPPASVVERPQAPDAHGAGPALSSVKAEELPTASACLAPPAGGGAAAVEQDSTLAQAGPADGSLGPQTSGAGPGPVAPEELQSVPASL